jgi:hypothetical protein
MFSPERLDLSKTVVYSAKGRHNLVTAENVLIPGMAKPELLANPDFDALVEKLVEAKKGSKTIICFYGAHVIKRGLSRYLIKLMEKGFISHLASNGAGSIHDFELALFGGTSEHVPSAIEDGTFGMWEETGSLMNEAIKLGAKKGWGYGESLASFVEENSSLFKGKSACVFYNAFKMGIPMTFHVTIGTDIIHQHPSADFGAIGATSGIDFAVFCKSVSKLDKGVFMNFGSAVTGPEVFLKALSISRNQGYKTFEITTANFDLVSLGESKTEAGGDNPQYYYRPAKNIVNRPVSKGGTGFHITGDHALTIPNLYERLAERGF